jgi:hypothetical protein
MFDRKAESGPCRPRQQKDMKRSRKEGKKRTLKRGTSSFSPMFVCLCANRPWLWLWACPWHGHLLWCAMLLAGPCFPIPSPPPPPLPPWKSSSSSSRAAGSQTRRSNPGQRSFHLHRRPFPCFSLTFCWFCSFNPLEANEGQLG